MLSKEKLNGNIPDTVSGTKHNLFRVRKKQNGRCYRVFGYYALSGAGY
jgi:hypothetical protein